MLPSISFETGRNTQTQSSGNRQGCASKWKSGSSIKKEPRLRGQHTRRRIRKNLHQRSSKARQENFCPLDKDLSWKSPYKDLATSQKWYLAESCNWRGGFAALARPKNGEVSVLT